MNIMPSSGESTKLFLLVQRQAGVSRRKAQDLVSAGEVSLDGAPVADPFLAVRPEEIGDLRLRGHPLSLVAPEFHVYRFHKPRGVLCSHDDPHEGNTVGRILRAEGFIGYSWAGRLDQDAEGLLLVTNDGTLQNVLSHPRYEIVKSYHVWLDRLPQRAAVEGMLRDMKRGISDDGDRLRIVSGRLAGRPPYIALALAEGRKREIKRLFAHFQLRVVRLLRVAVGPIELGDLRPGCFKRLSSAEITSLRRAEEHAAS